MAPPDPAAAKLIEPAKPLECRSPRSPMPEVVASAARRRCRGGRRHRAEGRDPAHRIRRRCRRRQFGRRLARAVARAFEIEVERAADGAAPDHRDQGRQQRARHAAAAGCRTAERRRRRRQDLRGADRKQAELRDRGVRRPASHHEGDDPTAPAASKPAQRRQAVLPSVSGVVEEPPKKPECRLRRNLVLVRRRKGNKSFIFNVLRANS